MIVRERAPLAPLTTLRVGGRARFFVEVSSEDDIRSASLFARERGLRFLPLGAGSNLLVPDAGVDALVVKIAIGGIAFVENGSQTLLVAGAGARWDDVVDYAASRGRWGIENLAGIPGTAAGAAVQNIGAYGAALSGTFAYVDAIDLESGERVRIAPADAAFGYRTSVFKQQRALVITHVALALRDAGPADLSYADLARVRESGTPLSTPSEVVSAVRAIRARKFPDPAQEGTAGSFFANPMLSRREALSLACRFAGLPLFSIPETNEVKVPLGWILDRVLGLRGLALGKARLYEQHALVIVAETGASAADVDALARDVATRVHAATGVIVTREVETFGA